MWYLKKTGTQSCGPLVLTFCIPAGAACPDEFGQTINTVAMMASSSLLVPCVDCENRLKWQHLVLCVHEPCQSMLSLDPRYNSVAAYTFWHKGGRSLHDASSDICPALPPAAALGSSLLRFQATAWCPLVSNCRNSSFAPPSSKKC